MYIDKRISARKLEHRAGFPDFMDLLVVCADSGLSMEASLERVSRELGPSYPSLTANIHLTNLEIRAGRPLKEALEHFADRLALEESRAFATLINQSIDLGSSITDAMRGTVTDAPQGFRYGRKACAAGETCSADDAASFGAVRGHPAAGDRAPGCSRYFNANGSGGWSGRLPAKPTR
jgi:hypothetical protein